MRLKTKDLPNFRRLLLEAQDSKCALCGIPLDPDTSDACLDHCHTTGHIRGVLCRNCNGVEGKIFNLARRAKRNRTPLSFLSGLLAYWEKHLSEPSGVWYPTHKTEDEKRELRNKKARQRRAQKKAK